MLYNYDDYIYLDGVDGTGKTTVVRMLREAGYTNVYDRSVLTKYSVIPLSKLPDKILDNHVVQKQLTLIKSTFSPSELVTNRDIMTKINVTDPNNDHPNNDRQTESDIYDNVHYFILTANPETARNRLLQREKETGVPLNLFDSVKSIQYFHAKYLFLAKKYQIPIISTDNYTPTEVFQQIVAYIDHVIELPECIPRALAINWNPDQLNRMLDLLELEWLGFGNSKIIYLSTTEYITTDGQPLNLVEYQDQFLKKLTTQNLTNFVHLLTGNTK